MTRNDEMKLGEWLIRMFCRTFALVATMLGAGGIAFILIGTIVPLVDRGAWVIVTCVTIACVAVVFGLAPMYLEVNKALLHFCGGLKPLRLEDTISD
jgi:uncharacterized membrane protein SirB2